MKRIKRFFLVFAVLMCVVFALWLVDSTRITAYAETLETVRLTPEQTLALYGRQLVAQYYDGSSWSNCIFEYYAKSSDFLSEYQPDVSGLGYNTYIVQAENTGMSTEQQDILLRENTFLFYRCFKSDFSTLPAETGQLEFEIPFSIDIRGIKSFRSVMLVSKDPQNPTDIFNCPLYYYSMLSCQPSILSTTHNNRFSPADNLNSTNAVVTNYIRTPFTNRSTQTTVFNPLAYFCMGTIGYSHIDPNTNLYDTFDMTSLSMTVTRCKPNYFETSDPIGGDAYIIGISTPIVTEGFVMPDSGGGSGSSPDYTDILNSNNTLLAQILAKLDLIYQKMNQEENVSLTPPQTIGFDSQTKSEIIGGLSSGASVLDSQSIPEAAQQAAGGVWAASDRLISSAPGLASIYMLFLVGGLVSWVLFGKRGG